jgi:hypothetical protein
VTVRLLPTIPAVALNLAVVEPEATVTLAGTVTAVLLLDSATTALPEAALFRLTVQLDVALRAIVDGLHLSELTCADAATVKVVCAEPL